MPKRGPRFSEKEKLAILKEGEKNGVKAVCAKYGISDQTYRAWRYQAAGIQPRKHLSSAKRLQVLREGEKNGVRAVCAKYGITDQTYRVWRYKAAGIQPRRWARKQFSTEEKLQILEEGYQNGIEQVCAAYRISSRTYYRWNNKLGST